jgi:hypothetical protein
MIISFYKQQELLFGFLKPENYADSVFESGSYSVDVLNRGDVIKALIAASCFVDGAEWRIKQKNGNIVYYQGTFELVQPESETL